jgi:hypothetical protein
LSTTTKKLRVIDDDNEFNDTEIIDEHCDGISENDEQEQKRKKNFLFVKITFLIIKLNRTKKSYTSPSARLH